MHLYTSAQILRYSISQRPRVGGQGWSGQRHIVEMGAIGNASKPPLVSECCCCCCRCRRRMLNIFVLVLRYAFPLFRRSVACLYCVETSGVAWFSLATGSQLTQLVPLGVDRVKSSGPSEPNMIEIGPLRTYGTPCRTRDA